MARIEEKIEKLLSKLDSKKRDQIINSALEEFSKNSFEKASTNKIVENANISKGLLFHYFGTKENLYKYLQYFTVKIIKEAIINKLNWNQKDLFLRIKEISIIKFEIFKKYPYLTDFALKVFKDKTVEELFEIVPDFPIELYSQVYTYNIDYSLFKENIDVEKAINIIRWTLEKCSEEIRRKIDNKNMNLIVDYKAIEKEIHQYIDMLKACFYK